MDREELKDETSLGDKVEERAAETVFVAINTDDTVVSNV
jgi:hypothetical protein